MTTAPVFNADQLTFADCRVTSFQLGLPGKTLPNPDDVAGFSYTFTSEQGVDFDNAIIRIGLQVVIEAKRTDETLPHEQVGEIHTETFFQVTGIDALRTQKPDGSPALPEMVGATALGLAFSTTRGMLLMLSAGSVLNQAFLPIINPLQLLRSSQPEQAPDTPAAVE